jgi:Domain of unknown function (DUF4326)
MPVRVKVTGDLFHGRIPPDAIYVGRQARGLRRSPFANPFTTKRYSRDEAIRRYREYLLTTPGLLDAARAELAGRDLACWCPLDSPCHADVLIELISARLFSPRLMVIQRIFQPG